MRFKQLCIWLTVLPILFAPYGSAKAAFGEDIEKPRPVFSQQDGDWIVKLIPRGKSSPIQIRFHVEGGTLVAVADKSYTPETHPKVDPKNFRSDFYSVRIDTQKPGAQVSVSLNSVYFTSATDLWGPRAPNSIAWGSTGAVNTALADRVNMLTVQLRDGGPLDADGTADGHIELVVGPRDSFWGYAMGTLFIRFFGIFIVLSILMIGILLSGKVFERIENRKTAVHPPQSAPAPGADAVSAQTAAAVATGIAPEEVAAIALAIHLDRIAMQSLAPAEQGPASSWALFGRGKLLADRMPVFDRIHSQ